MSSTAQMLHIAAKYGGDNKKALMKDLRVLRAQLSREIVKPFNMAIAKAKLTVNKYEYSRRTKNILNEPSRPEVGKGEE